MMSVLGVWLLAMLLMMGCASGSEEIEEVETVQTPKVVEAQLNFSLPSRITHRKSVTTRMSGEVVQEGSEDDDVFRGIDNVHLLCYDQYPTETSTKLGGIVDIKTSGELVNDTVTQDDYALSQGISIPVGTSYFGFYASASEDTETPMTLHERRMHFGVIETVGLDKNTYQDNSGIRFRPVQICNSTDVLGGSVIGHDLLNLLNDLMNITGTEEAPNDKWETAGNIYLNETYQKMTQLTTLSSYNVQTMLGTVVKVINQEAVDEQGSQLVAAITAKIAECCVADPDIAAGTLVLKDSLQGFPDDIHLPAGSARIKWNKEKEEFEVPDVQAYGNDLNVTSVNDYVYPMNLRYQVFSNILASEELVIMSGTDEEGRPVAPDSIQYKDWNDVITNGYADAGNVVQPTTQSVAMVKQVEYSVGRLAIRSRIGIEKSICDANGAVVSVTDNSFTLKGYIVGGQREVDYDFQPVMSSRTYAIYDTDLNGGVQLLKRYYYTEPDYILGLGTPANNTILVALELVNNGPAFQGADGLIATGATFYVVANMNPQEGTNYSSGILDKIFSKDRATQVNITINSLANATYGLPNLEIPRPTLGVSVNLAWGEGLWFDDVPLF
jgi:hypothetical protein